MGTLFTRRWLMRSAALTSAAVASSGFCGGGARADTPKVPQAEAEYRPRPNGIQRCEICLQFNPPNSCKLVAGEISPKGWCQYFAAKEGAD